MDSPTAPEAVGRDGRPLPGSPTSDDLDRMADRLRQVAEGDLPNSVREALDAGLEGHEKRRRQLLDH